MAPSPDALTLIQTSGKYPPIRPAMCPELDRKEKSTRNMQGKIAEGEQQVFVMLRFIGNRDGPHTISAVDCSGLNDKTLSGSV